MIIRIIFAIFAVIAGVFSIMKVDNLIDDCSINDVVCSVGGIAVYVWCMFTVLD